MQRSASLSLILIALVIGCSAEPPKVVAVSDFHRDIRPIFEQRCVNCHGAMQQLGGLRLDDRNFAISGGVSGKRLGHMPLEANELLRRITSSDPAIRMPKEGGALGDAEVMAIRRWIEADTPWPDLVRPTGWESFRLAYWNDLWKRLSVFGGEIKVYLLLLFAIVIAAGDRIRRANVEAGSRWASGWRRRLWHASQHISLWLWLSGVLFIVAWDLVEFSMRQAIAVVEADARLTELAHQRNGIVPPSNAAKPTPVKPRSPVPFGGTYYRGNDERNERLFNGGSYRTATMILSLVDEQGKVIRPGDRVSGETLSVRLEIQRASQATPTLFTDELFQEVLLTQRTSDPKQPQPADEPARVSVIESGERWLADYRLTDYHGEPTTAVNGIVYVFGNAKLADELVTGVIHYGIVCSLKLFEGTLQENSELWMGPVLLPGNFQPIDPTKITLDEWLSLQPIPEIEGENSTDPKLLGVPEHKRNSP